MSGTCKQPSPGRAEVQKALLQLVKQYVSTDAPLSPWERHCLSSALLFECYGYFDKALEKIKDVLEPPFPLPAFPTAPQMTLRDVVAHLLQSDGSLCRLGHFVELFVPAEHLAGEPFNRIDV